MSHFEPRSQPMHPSDTAPGDERLDREEIAEGIRSYLIGLGLAALLTAVSFFIARTTLVWQPSIPVALVVLAIAQMGVHLVFFLHITTGPDNVNNVMALAFGVLIVLLLLAGSLWIMANLNRNMGHNAEVMETQLEGGRGIRAAPAIGVIAPAATAPVTARASGIIQALQCEANMHVKAGQLCAKIDPRPYQTAVEQSGASLQAAEARLEKDKAKLARAKAALEHQQASASHRTAPQKALDKLRKSFEAAQAETERDEALTAGLREALHAAEMNLASTNITSPVDGTVISRHAELGQTVAAGPDTPLFVIAPDSALVHVNATVSLPAGHEINLGDKAMFTVEAFPDRQFSGSLTHIGPPRRIDEHASMTDVVITAPNPDFLLKPGMQATIRIAIK